LIFFLPLLRGHSKSLGNFVQIITNGIKRSATFLMSKHEQTRYEPVPAQPSSGSSSPRGEKTDPRLLPRRKRERSNRGPYWTLSKNTCAICHHRLRDTIDAQLGLPAIQPTTTVTTGSAAIGRLTGEDVDPEQEGGEQGEDNEETRIHLPAKTDCEEECRYCYYCISEALTIRAKEVAGLDEVARKGAGDDAKEKVIPPKGWGCLRCGEEVWNCIRITT
jgi:hypothetical protein